MTNGIGTWFCTAHFDPGWGWDDAVECAMFLYFPVWPLRVVHLREIPGGSFAPDKYQAFPLRWSDQFVRHVFIRRWLVGFVGLGALLLLVLVLVTLWPRGAASEWAWLKPVLTPLAACLVGGGLVGQLLLRPHARRQRDVRRLLGLHNLGSSDPATWVDEDLARVPKPKDLFGTESYAAAVPALLTAGAWAGAAWASRLTAALESRDAGEGLTAEVLRHPGVREALTRFQRDKTRWGTAMGADAQVQYQARQHVVGPPPLFDLLLIEQKTQQQTTEQQDQWVAAFGAVFALIGVGVGAWLGSMAGLYVALLGAVVGAVVGAVTGVLLGAALLTGR
jgi:hypothetical protein